MVISLSNLPKITQSVNTELRTSHVPAGVAMAVEATRSLSLWSEDQKAWIKCRQGHSPSEGNGKDSAEGLTPGLRVPWPWLCDSNLAWCPPCLPVSRAPHFNTSGFQNDPHISPQHFTGFSQRPTTDTEHPSQDLKPVSSLHLALQRSKRSELLCWLTSF